MHNYLFAKGKKTFKLGISEYSDMVSPQYARSFFLCSCSRERENTNTRKTETVLVIF